MNEEVQKVLQELKGGITTEVFEKLMAELPNRKDIFGGQSPEAKADESKAKSAEYLKALYEGDTAHLKAMSVGTNADGGFLAPDYFASEVIRVAGNYGLVRRLARPWEMAGKTEKIPTAGSVTTYRVNEKAKATSSQPTIGQVTLTAKKLVAMIPVSNELLEDANINLVDLLTLLAGESLAKKEDEWGLKGLGAGEGIFQSTTAPVVTMAATNTTYEKADFLNLIDVMNQCNEDALAKARWIMSFSVFNGFRKIQAGAGDKQHVLQHPGSGMPATLWNFPVEFSSIMPKTTDGSQAGTKFFTLANFDYMMFGDRKQVTVEISKDATITDTDGTTPINLFEQDMSAVRVIERVDIQLAEADKAFAVLKTAAA